MPAVSIPGARVADPGGAWLGHLRCGGPECDRECRCAQSGVGNITRLGDRLRLKGFSMASGQGRPVEQPPRRIARRSGWLFYMPCLMPRLISHQLAG